MRPAGGASPRYVAGNVPASADALSGFLREELAKLHAALDALADGHLEQISVAPAKPREGMIRCAAPGVLGAAGGFYGYYGGWNFLG